MACGDQTCSLPRLTSDSATTINHRVAPIRRTIYESIVMYYGNPTMYKVDSPNHMFSMYVIGITCFCADKRYLIAVCQPDQRGLGSSVSLSQLNWISFQARVSPTDYHVPSIHYQPTPSIFTNSQINQIPSQNNVATYSVLGFPLRIQLVGNGGYRADGTVGEALETFSTVIFFA